MKIVIIASISSLAILCVAAVVSSKNFSGSSLNELSRANVEALAAPQAQKKIETVADFMREYMGCPGGNQKCFVGTIGYGGFFVSGTWYKK